jgi:hypothetical protein
MSTTNYFAELSKIDVSEHVEKKGKFSYLSWAWAVDQLRKKHPDATWEVIRFNGMPFMNTDCGYFVEVAVTVNGVTLSQIHPVLDNFNKPIAKPNSFQINTSIQRCLVKAIALHGLGLYIYAGEDLPLDAEEPPKNNKSEQSLSPTLRGKWKLLEYPTEKFEEWYDGQVSKGYNETQMDKYLTQKLMEKKGA